MRDVLDKLKQYPASDFYRFVVNGQLHSKEHGWVGYALREPGCVEGILEGFQCALEDITNVNLSVELLLNIHKNVTQKITFRNGPNHFFSGQFRNSVPRFMLLDERFPFGYCNKEGLVEIIAFIEKYDTEGAGLIFESEQEYERRQSANPEQAKQEDIIFRSMKSEHERLSYQNLEREEPWIFRTPFPEHVPLLVSKLLESYNHAIKRAESAEEKLDVIVSHVQELERIHPFADGNGRTSYILLQRLLIQNGFLPTIMANPNHLDGFDKHSVITEIKQGMLYTQALIDNPQANVFEYCTENIVAPEEPKDDFEKEFYVPMPVYVGRFHVDPDVIHSYNQAISNLKSFIYTLDIPRPAIAGSPFSMFPAASATIASSPTEDASLQDSDGISLQKR